MFWTLRQFQHQPNQRSDAKKSLCNLLKKEDPKVDCLKTTTFSVDNVKANVIKANSDNEVDGSETSA
jgi:hypothetical protein